eukprot:g3684.t1
MSRFFAFFASTVLSESDNSRILSYQLEQPSLSEYQRPEALQAKFSPYKARPLTSDASPNEADSVLGWHGQCSRALLGGSSSGPQVDGGADAWTQAVPGAKVPVAQQRVEAGSDVPQTAPGPAAIEPSASHDSSTKPEPPDVPESMGWEAQFAWGLYYSKRACFASESGAGPWALDRKGSRAGELLDVSIQAAPQEEKRKKLAERALRLYYHAKWLAERNHATAAEWRYREASRLALQTRRKVLAAHALGRFGYFLIHWNRRHEAKEVLRESRRISSKSNPLAPYLLGVLERQVGLSSKHLSSLQTPRVNEDAGADLERLKAAEAERSSGAERGSGADSCVQDLILGGGEQPSEEPSCCFLLLF